MIANPLVHSFIHLHERHRIAKESRRLAHTAGPERNMLDCCCCCFFPAFSASRPSAVRECNQLAAAALTVPILLTKIRCPRT